MRLLFFILEAMRSLAPARDHGAVATAIAQVIDAERPLFADDDSKLRTAAFLVAVAFRESSLRPDAIGDHGRARCLFQLWDAPADVLTDPVLCTTIALGRMRDSMRACGAANLLGLYAAGPKGCSSEHAKRISRDRLHLAGRLGKAAPP